MDATNIFLLVKVDDIRALLDFIGSLLLACGVVGVFAAVVVQIAESLEGTNNVHIRKLLFITCGITAISIAVFIISALIPSSEQMEQMEKIKRLQGSKQAQYLHTGRYQQFLSNVVHYDYASDLLTCFPSCHTLFLSK